MKKSTFILTVFVGAWLAIATGCTFSQQGTEERAADSITLMTWNVHNLFDGNDNGNEYDEFKEASGWSQEKYLGRINSISAAIAAINIKPDIILFQEIESGDILEDLASLLSGNYSWSHFAKNTEAALGLGVLSKLPLVESMVHSITIGDETSPRPVLEVRVEAEKEQFVIFVCHWKSKVGGDDATEGLRRASARVILRRIRELSEEEPDTGIIVAGDLNLNHDDFFRRGGNIVCSLMPDDPFSAQTAGLQRDYIVLSKNKPPQPVYFPQDTVVLYSPWFEDVETADENSSAKGTYYYSSNWETIDHFLISGQFFNDKGWEYENFTVISHHPFTNNNGIPQGYNVRTGAGLSDHLPLLIQLSNKK